MEKAIKEYVKILIGSLGIAIGLYFFLAPAQLAAGGISGIAIVIKSVFPLIPIGIIIMILDVIMFAIGFIILGKTFGIKSIISSLSISLYMVILEWILPHPAPLSKDNLIILLLGTLFAALGQAIIFNQGASSGGTDIIAKIIHKYIHINIGTSLMLADMAVVVVATTVLGIEKGLYAAVGVLTASILVDYFISGFTVSKYVMIIASNKGTTDAIHDFILNQLDRGATTYSAEGAYSKEPKAVITTVVDRRQFIILRQYVRQKDSRAFMTVQNLHEVVGEGFEE